MATKKKADQERTAEERLKTGDGPPPGFSYNPARGMFKTPRNKTSADLTREIRAGMAGDETAAEASLVSAPDTPNTATTRGGGAGTGGSGSAGAGGGTGGSGTAGAG